MENALLTERTFDVFIAYHGTDDPSGSIGKAEEIYNLLASLGINCFFNPVTNKGGRFGDTPTCARHSKLFLLVANSHLKTNGYNEIVSPGLYNEIDAFRGVIFNDPARKGNARVYCYDGLTVQQADRLDTIFSMVEHFEEGPRTNAQEKLIQWIQSSLYDKIRTVIRTADKENISTIEVVKMRKDLIIEDLIKLQNNYTLSPIYTTTEQHIVVSKESDIIAGGTARILTNSLAFDSDPTTIAEILNNIILGAKYIYYMPHNSNIYRELGAYVGLCFKTVTDKLPLQGTSDSLSTSEEVLKRIEFRLFDDGIYCIYNFALFNQLSTQQNNFQGFRQGWWYINPQNGQQTMIANELDSSYNNRNSTDRDMLEGCLNRLSEVSTSFTAYELLQNQSNLDSYIVEKIKEKNS